MTTASVSEQRSKFEERFQAKSSQQTAILQKVTNKLEARNKRIDESSELSVGRNSDLSRLGRDINGNN